jgi:hypothetical protein
MRRNIVARTNTKDQVLFDIYDKDLVATTANQGNESPKKNMFTHAQIDSMKMQKKQALKVRRQVIKSAKKRQSAQKVQQVLNKNSVQVSICSAALAFASQTEARQKVHQSESTNFQKANNALRMKESVSMKQMLSHNTHRLGLVSIEEKPLRRRLAQNVKSTDQFTKENSQDRHENYG